MQNRKENFNRREFLKASAMTAMAFSTVSLNPVFADSAKSLVPSFKLSNGVQMPSIGLGVLAIKDLKECQRVVEDALQVGYRLFDTAQSYGNEEGVGYALKATGIKRSEIFITTKIFKSNANEAALPKSFDESLKKLNTDYVDLLLIHQPVNDTYGAWRAMSKIYKAKRAMAIGVSNFAPYRLIDFFMNNEIKPAINQVECHPFYQQEEAHKLMKEWNIQMEAFSPFSQGKHNIFKNAVLEKIAKKHNKTIAQVILRWIYQRGIISIPKTTSKERMIENISIFNFSLDNNDLAQIKTLETGKPNLDHRNVDTIKWLNERTIGSSRS